MLLAHAPISWCKNVGAIFVANISVSKGADRKRKKTRINLTIKSFPYGLVGHEKCGAGRDRAFWGPGYLFSKIGLGLLLNK
jgi:hypothetical protein